MHCSPHSVHCTAVQCKCSAVHGQCSAWSASSVQCVLWVEAACVEGGRVAAVCVVGCCWIPHHAGGFDIIMKMMMMKMLMVCALYVHWLDFTAPPPGCNAHTFHFKTAHAPQSWLITDAIFQHLSEWRSTMVVCSRVAWISSEYCHFWLWWLLLFWCLLCKLLFFWLMFSCCVMLNCGAELWCRISYDCNYDSHHYCHYSILLLWLLSLWLWWLVLCFMPINCGAVQSFGAELWCCLLWETWDVKPPQGQFIAGVGITKTMATTMWKCDLNWSDQNWTKQCIFWCQMENNCMYK